MFERERSKNPYGDQRAKEAHENKRMYNQNIENISKNFRNNEITSLEPFEQRVSKKLLDYAELDQELRDEIIDAELENEEKLDKDLVKTKKLGKEINKINEKTKSQTKHLIPKHAEGHAKILEELNRGFMDEHKRKVLLNQFNPHISHNIMSKKFYN